MARMVEIEIQAGSSEEIVVSLLDRNSAPIPSFVGWRGIAQVRYTPSEASAVLYEWDTVDSNMTLVPGAESRAVLAMPSPEVSLLWTWRLAYFDLALRDGAGVPAGLPVRGIIRVTPGVTRFPTI